MWFNNPESFVDGNDIYSGDACVEHVKEVLRDKLISRPTELSALTRLFALSLHKVNTLTKKQSYALVLMRDAINLKRQATNHIARELHITQRAAQRLIKRTEKRLESEMFAFDENLDVYSNDASYKAEKAYPSEKEIQSMMASMKTTCAACGADIPGRFSLCFECYKRYGKTREEWKTSKVKGQPAPAAWLISEANRLRAQLRKEAINELYRVGDYDLEEYENVLLRRAG